MARPTNDRHRSSEEIRQDVDRTRAHLEETVDALENRLTPGRIVDQLWGRVWGGGKPDGGAVTDALRDHPVPLALMGLGLGWLAIEQTASRGGRSWGRSVGPGTYEPAAGRRGPYGSEAAHGGGESGPGWTDRAREAGERAREKFREAGEKVSPGDSGESAQRAAHSASHAMEQGRHRLEEGRHRLEEGTYQAQRRLGRMFEENPVGLAAIALGVGIASGISVPSSETESRLAGRQAETLKGEAMERGEEAVDRATEVGEEAASAAGQEMERQSENPEGGPRAEQESGAESEGPGAGAKGEKQTRGGADAPRVRD